MLNRRMNSRRLFVVLYTVTTLAMLAALAALALEVHRWSF